jgi:mannonate dehydratase
MLIQDQVRYHDLGDEILSFYRAVSVDTIHLELRGGPPPAKSESKLRGGSTGHANTPIAQRLRNGEDCTEEFEKARDLVEAHDMKLNNVFMSCWEEIALAMEDRDEKIGHWCQMLESLGKAGIPALGWNFKPMGNFRTPADTGRGGVKYSTFDYDYFMQNRPELYDPPVSEETMWANMETFLKAVIPVAEKAGVRMALHPDDPPIPESLGGIAQICSSLEQFRRTFFEIAPSDSNGMLFCQGCMTELLGDGVYDAIAEMASQNKVIWVHFRNVKGQLPRFVEVFMDEGDIDMKRSMEIYRDNGFNGPYMMDHTPSFPHEAHGQLHGKAYAIGYIRALIDEVYG